MMSNEHHIPGTVVNSSVTYFSNILVVIVNSYECAKKESEELKPSCILWSIFDHHVMFTRESFSKLGYVCE